VNGRVDEALIWYSRAVENDARSPSLRAGLVLAYLELDDPDSAGVWVEEALELGPDTFWALWASTLYNLYIGDDSAAQQDARTLVGLFPRTWGGLRILRDADIRAGRFEAARSRYERGFREFFEPEVPEVNAWNYFAAIDLALVLMHMGESTRANDLIEGSLEVIESIPRMGITGYWVNDARAYAAQNRPEQAFAALRQAIDAGWRFNSWYHFEQDPNFDALRGTREFDAFHDYVRADLAEQARRMRDLKASGELASVRGIGLPLQ
jgi:tetratricopeptide (TPR) repeat protein